MRDKNEDSNLEGYQTITNNHFSFQEKQQRALQDQFFMKLPTSETRDRRHRKQLQQREDSNARSEQVVRARKQLLKHVDQPNQQQQGLHEKISFQFDREEGSENELNGQEDSMEERPESANNDQNDVTNTKRPAISKLFGRSIRKRDDPTSASHRERVESLTNAIRNHSRVLEEVVYPTENDPDGLKEKLALRWDKVQCDFNPELAPPKIQLESPLIVTASEGVKHPHSGVLIDAARHFFPLPWLRGLIDFLAVLGYDLIHFRLTDDQSFAVQLDCHPELARAAHYNRTSEYYTAQELRDLVRYAKDRGIFVVPEINLPGHAGGWSGIPGVLYPCVNFICSTSYSIPMRVNEPKVLIVIEDVLREVLDIFDNPLYLHLGGDEVWMSDACLSELQVQPNFHKFEKALGEMLLRLNYDASKVIRWEGSGRGDSGVGVVKVLRLNIPLKRAGEITHWWHSVPTSNVDLARPFFISSDLYFDASLDKDAWDIATIAAERYALRPSAVVAATFELGPCSFHIRDVWGKLIAVAMASRKDMPKTRKAFMAEYRDLCPLMGLPDSICVLEGKPSIATVLWKSDHNVLKKAWSATICDRLTYPSRAFGMRWNAAADHYVPDQYVFTRAKELRTEISDAKATTNFLSAKNAIYLFPNNHTGVMVDLAHQYFPMKDLRRIIDFVSLLGFNLLHVRLIANEYFPIKLLEHDRLALRYKPYTESYTEDQLRQLVEYAANRGVRIMPELNVLSNAGGWQKSGLLVSCPNYVCRVAGPIPLDVNKGGTLSTVGIVTGGLLQIFSTAPFLHLGSVDPDVAEPCYREAYPSGEIDMRITFSGFEDALLSVFQAMGVEKTQIAVWKSQNYQSHAGIVHYSNASRAVNDTRPGPFLLSTDISVPVPGGDSPWNIYQNARLSHSEQAAGFVVLTKGLEMNDWESINVFGRLIAIAAALSSQEGMDQKTFESHYSTVCAKFGMSPTECHSFGEPVSKSIKRQDLVEVERRTAKCKRYTIDEIARLPKESTFGADPLD